MTDIVEQLMPCPFCGHDRGEIHHNPKTILHPAYRVECGYCGASGPETDRGDHVEQWNNQPLRQQLASYIKEDEIKANVNKLLVEQLAECQALQDEPVAQICSWGCQLIGDTADEFKKDRVKFMGTPLYAAPVNLDTLKRQWQREALLEAADFADGWWVDTFTEYQSYKKDIGDELRRMAKELE